MAIDLSEERAIDARDGRFRAMLENLQGNILKAHGRKHVRLLFLQLDRSPGLVPWFQKTTRAVVTSAKRQRAEAEYNRMGRETGIFGNLFLTAAGYELLGYDARLLDYGFGEEEKRVRFSSGMVAAASELGDDGDTSAWETPHQGVHAMLLLAASDSGSLDEVMKLIKGELDTGIGRILHRESGAVLREDGDRGDTIEPFGYVDGRSQPLFFAEDLERERRRGGSGPWNPLAPLDLVLVPDPFTGEEDSFGSFVVFRKLEQDVEGFGSRLDQLANELPGVTPDQAGARVVGRFRNGTPIVKHANAIDGPPRRFNSFDFSLDPSGDRCPIHAHIRLVNTREEEKRKHRIVRRGIPYDSRSITGPPSGARGMLFLCFQASIADQFAVLQKNLADPDAKDFSDYVKLRGGEFFFAPSIPFLLNPLPREDF